MLAGQYIMQFPQYSVTKLFVQLLRYNSAKMTNEVVNREAFDSPWNSYQLHHEAVGFS